MKNLLSTLFIFPPPLPISSLPVLPLLLIFILFLSRSFFSSLSLYNLSSSSSSLYPTCYLHGESQLTKIWNSWISNMRLSFPQQFLWNFIPIQSFIWSATSFDPLERKWSESSSNSLVSSFSFNRFEILIQSSGGWYWFFHGENWLACWFSVSLSVMI